MVNIAVFAAFSFCDQRHLPLNPRIQADLRDLAT